MSQSYWNELESQYREMKMQDLGAEVTRLSVVMSEAVTHATRHDRLDSPALQEDEARLNLATEIYEQRQRADDPEDHPLFDVMYRILDETPEGKTYKFSDIVLLAKIQDETPGLTDDEIELICNLAVEAQWQNQQFLDEVEKWGDLITDMLKAGKSEAHMVNRLVKVSNRMVCTEEARELIGYVEDQMYEAALPDYPGSC